MSNLPISSKYRSTPDKPVSDDEREQLVARLNQAFADGAMDADAYQALLDRTFTARTLGELVPVVEVLPPVATYAEPGVVAQSGRPGELSEPRRPNTALVAAAVGIGVVALVVLAVLLMLLL